MMDEIRKALQLKEELDALRPLDQEWEKRIIDKLILDWNYHSNHLEGNSLTFEETQALLLQGKKAEGKPRRDHLEIAGHNEAILTVFDTLQSQRLLTENFIRELHHLILREPYEKEAITADGKPTRKLIKVGQYKSTPNHVRISEEEIFRFASPEETPAKMHDLLEWYRESIISDEINPILLAAEFHYRFIVIHPFDDGNGRTARILMNFILMQFGYPVLVIKTEDKENYFKALRQADADTENLDPFVQYIAKSLVESLELLLSGQKFHRIQVDK